MAATLIELISEKFGVNVGFRENPEADDVDIAVKTIFRQSPNRLGFVLINLGSSPIFVAPDERVSSTRGLRLGANGGQLVLVWDEDFILPALEWHATTTVDNQAIYTLEVFTV